MWMECNVLQPWMGLSSFIGMIHDFAARLRARKVEDASFKRHVVLLLHM
jgi:hypothetical protein